MKDDSQAWSQEWRQTVLKARENKKVLPVQGRPVSISQNKPKPIIKLLAQTNKLQRLTIEWMHWIVNWKINAEKKCLAIQQKQTTERWMKNGRTVGRMEETGRMRVEK